MVEEDAVSSSTIYHRLLIIWTGMVGLRRLDPPYKRFSHHSLNSPAKRPAASSQAEVEPRGSYVVTSNDRATMERISAKEATRPRPISCMSTLPAAVASTGPATTARPQASAVNWQ